MSTGRDMPSSTNGHTCKFAHPIRQAASLSVSRIKHIACGDIAPQQPSAKQYLHGIALAHYVTHYSPVQHSRCAQEHARTNYQDCNSNDDSP